MFKSLFNKDGQGKAARSAGTEETSHYQKEMIEPSTIDSFELGPILGTGRCMDHKTFSEATKATKRTVAIKMLSKSQILKTKQVTHIKAEKEILMAVSHPFIVSLYGSSQDQECLYFILEYVVGGEFFTHLRSQGRFSEDTSRFYASEILLTFEYLHGLDIIYRDLKPENLLLDKTGHIKITDFGFAKKIDHRTYTLCGTPDYLAPEIILNKGHGKPVDWWAMGVLIYEMMAGYPPFYDEDPMGTYQKILHGKLEFASHFSRGARDLVKKLLQADLTKRYGNLKGGARDIKQHPWFSGVDFDAIIKRTKPGPIVITAKSEDDTSNFDDYSDIGPMEHEFRLTDEDQMAFSDF